MFSRVSSSLARAAPSTAGRSLPAICTSLLPVSTVSSSLPAQRAFSSRSQHQQQQQGFSATNWTLPVLTATAVGVWLLKEERDSDGATVAANAEPDYAAVRRAIADSLDDESWDDGSRGPLLVRLAWHAAGTYDKSSGTGGSNGATMRFPPESSDGANNGLANARAFLEPIKKKFPWITYADLWTLAGVVAIEEMGGPKIPWRPGRSDAADGKSAPPNGRLPDATKKQDHIRSVFGRMGFNDQEMVVLIGGGHAIGRCHKNTSGFVGPWTNSPITFSNEFFRLLVEEKWNLHNKFGNLQYEDRSKQLMMLPADMALIEDSKFKQWVEIYAKDNERFFKDFANAFGKLMELGVKFPNTSKYV